jgi:hypothetical protein
MARNRIIGLARNTDEIADRFKERKESLGLSDLFCDELGGLSSGHTAKLLSPARTKGLGRFTLDTLSEVLAVSFLIVEDSDKLRRMEHRYEQRVADRIRVRTIRLSSAAKAQAKHEIFSELGRLGGEARTRNLTPAQRSKLARKAAHAMHAKRRALVEAA